jgi:hypothetical protein
MRRRELSRSLIVSAAAAALLPGRSRAGGYDACSSHPLTGAETSASVKPQDTAYLPGDLRRYGARPEADITQALASAVAQAQRPGGSPVYVPAALGNRCTVNAGVVISAPITLYGDNRYQSVISTNADITILTVSGAQSQGVLIRDLQLVGKGAGATRPGISFSGSPYNALERVRVRNFGIGVQFATGGYSSFLNRILGSEIISNNAVNIDCQSQTHQLSLHQVTFGGGAPIGLHLVDSSGLSVFGGDCEGCTRVCIDLDNATTRNGNHYLCGLDLEGNHCADGDVRIGNTAMVNGVTLVDFGLSPGAHDKWFVNPVRCGGLTVAGCKIWSGYASGSWINRAGELSNLVCAGNGGRLDGSGQPLGPAPDSFWSPAGHPQAYRVPQVFDRHYQDSASYSQYAAITTDLNVPEGRWYAGLDVMQIHRGAPPASGVKAYARAMIAKYDGCGELKCGAALMHGAVDIEGPLGIIGQAVTGAQGAIFSATNKPGGERSAPSKWLAVTLDGTQYYIPCWQ